MDAITQGLLGAAIGQAAYSKKLGRKAMLWGAAAGMLPDIDIILAALGTWNDFLYHRGPTHSVWFGPVLGPFLGWALWKRYGRIAGHYSAWAGLMVWALFTHPLLDVFTTYGTQLLSPFSDARFTLDSIGIIDPAYSLPLALALLLGRRLWTWAALAATTLYLFYGMALNIQTKDLARDQLAKAGIHEARVEAYPTVLQIYLRRVVVWTPDQILVGYMSMWRPQPIQWKSVPIINTPRIEQALSSREGQIFNWFTSGQYSAQDLGAAIEIDDMRFGLPVGPPGHGMWGVRGAVQPDGSLQFERFRRPPPAPISVLWNTLWDMAFPAPA